MVTKIILVAIMIIILIIVEVLFMAAWFKFLAKGALVLGSLAFLKKETTLRLFSRKKK